MKSSRRYKNLFVLLVSLGVALSSCGVSENTSDGSTKIEGLEIGIVDNDVYEIGESCSYAVTLPSGSSASWSLNGPASSGQEGLTASFSIEYTFRAYGDYALALTVASSSTSISKSYEIHCLDLTKAVIEEMPEDKTIEAGTQYSFSDDLASIKASDNSGLAPTARVVSISFGGQKIKSAPYIESYQFKESGDYVIEVRVSDLNENYAKGTYVLHVYDTKSPILSGESAYEVFFNEDYDIVFPTIGITEYSPYSIAYAVTSLDAYEATIDGGKLIAPHIGDYRLTYSVDDGINAISTFLTKLTVKNPDPTFAWSNDLGSVYDNVSFNLPTPQVKGLTNAAFTYKASDDNVSISSTGSMKAKKTGTFEVSCSVSGTYYLGGEKHKEDGSKQVALSKSLQVEVSSRGTMDMESHNGSSPSVWNSSDSNVIRLVDGAGVDGSSALEFDTMSIGWNRFATLANPIPAPESYDALRVWVKCGGVKPQAYMYVILVDSAGNQNRADFYIEALVGQYYTVSLSGPTLQDIKQICIANRLGENGETTTDPDTGVTSSIGENRSFYLDDISLVTMPTLTVDSSSLAPVMVEGSSLDLPKETVGNYDGDYSCSVWATHNGVKEAVDDYHLDSLKAGTYLFTYEVKAGGAALSASFEIAVYEKKAAVVLYNDYGLLREGGSAALPKAYLIDMGSADSADGQYSYSYENGAYSEVSGSIENLQKGTYTVKYEITYSSVAYSDSFTFKVAGGPSEFTFDEVNKGTDGEIQEVHGNASPTAAISDGKLVLGGWWGGCIFKEDLTLSGMSDLYLDVKAKTGLSQTAIIFLDSSYRSGGGGFHSTEDLGIFYDVPANTDTTIHVELPEGLSGICGIEILTKNSSVEVDSLRLEAKTSKIPSGKTGVFQQADYVDVTPTSGTLLSNSPVDDALKVYGQWVCGFTLGEDQVSIPSAATSMSITMKANQKIPGMFLRLKTKLGYVYDDETVGVDVPTAYKTFSFTLNSAYVGSSLVSVELWVQDSTASIGWKVLSISSITFAEAAS